jgi:pyruvate/2-oxoglutarate dehydrogenase complex dihydrolipoamide acyltransferase (E2) component
MLYQITIPPSISDAQEVRILEWHLSVGQRFCVGDLILEVETQKAIVEIRAQQSGVLRDTYFHEGEWILLESFSSLALFSDEITEPVDNLLNNVEPLNIDLTII